MNELRTARLALVAVSFALACGDEGARTSAGESTLGGTGDTSGASSGAASADSGSADQTSATAASTGDVPGACEGPPVDPPTDALVLDGVDDHVAMGVAPPLGLAAFTLEAWVRRDGAGLTSGSGQGGISGVPIIAKGRGESDGSNVDCNYFFGFVDGALGADFEDMESGANHPVLGSTVVPTGEWHHVAVTYDGNDWRLYLDGEVDGAASANATPRADSIQHFALGTAMDSTGAPAGALHGALDEVRVWGHARTQAEIAAAMYTTVAAGAGLVARWMLDEADAGAPDSVGDLDGTLVGGPTWTAPGPVLDLGAPATATLQAPQDDTSLPPGMVELAVQVDDPELADAAVTFHLRQGGALEDFTIIVLPDTQYYSETWPEHFHAQTQWIMDNVGALDIRAVIHNGDLVDNGNQFDSEWVNADAAMTTIEAPSASFPDGLPYHVAVGNHDSTDGSTQKYNLWFGEDRFLGRAYYGGHYGSDNDNSYFTFAVGDLDFLVITVEYDTTPEAAVMTWLDDTIAAHPDHIAIVNSHYIVGTGNPAAFGTQGQAVFDEVADRSNVKLLTCGHIAGEGRRVDPGAGGDVHTMLADYQGRTEGGQGWLRIWEVSPANGEIAVRTYTPSLDQWETDDDSEFTIAVDFGGGAAPFMVADVADPVATGTVASAMVEIEAGRSYEWYVTVDDCAHTWHSPVWSFTAQ